MYHKANCASCHSSSQSIGPDLAGVARRFSRADLFTAIVQPSRDVAPRYQVTVVDALPESYYSQQHIPGALNRPFAQNLGPDGRFKSPSALKADFDALLQGRDPAGVVHHCGSGVSAVPNVLAMELAGLGQTALYAGSWSEWCHDPSRPVEKG